MKNKQIIDKYTEPIFSSGTIYVIKNADIDYLAKRFYYDGGKPNELKESLEDVIKHYEGATYFSVLEKKTEKYAILIILNPGDKYKPSIVNTMAHESLHAAFRMMDHNALELDKSTNELFANLVGWITECCYKTYFNIK